MGAAVLTGRLLAAVLGAGLVLAGAPPVRAQAPQDCERCHANREFLLQAASGRNVAARLVVSRATLAGGPHARVACAACHDGVQAYPHEPDAALNVRCNHCHAAQDSLWKRGVHAAKQAGRSAASCVACHGGHGIARSGFLPTAEGRSEMRAACARCHPEQVRSAARDVHADTIACTRCHGSHDMRPVPDAATHLIDVRLARACSGCHPGEAASYWNDVHGRTAARQASGAQPIGADTAATCIACHGEHGIRVAADTSWKSAVIERCTLCHERYGATYRDSYHGQASRVGSHRVAGCADCHSPHAILPAADTASSVSAGHRLATCRRCHSGASENFLGYRPHANPRSRAQNPPLFYVWLFMNTALFGTMIVWGAHTLLWYRRIRADRRLLPAADHGQRRPLDAARRGAGPFVWRFNVVFRIVHAMVVATFFVLVITGLPLRFSCTAWAPGLMQLLGGPGRAGLFHRIAGVLVFGYFAIYVGYVARRLWTAKDRRRLLIGADAIVFRFQDLKDLLQMGKYFVGRGPQPRFGRFSYMEKFDYFAELWGVGAIGATGLMLWQPVFFARFFPGAIFNVAIIVHSYEAMIATAFIFVIHFFNVHLRPGKWPLDAVMLTGRATMHYMEEEHPLLAEEIAASVAAAEPSRRAIADLPAPPPPRWLNRAAAVSGLTLLGVGLALIGLIMWGLMC